MSPGSSRSGENVWERGSEKGDEVEQSTGLCKERGTLGGL